MNTTRVEEQLKKLKESRRINPDANWVSQTREKLKTHMQMHQFQQKSVSHSGSTLVAIFGVLRRCIPKPVLLGVRHVAVVILIITVAISGWGVSVSASQDSLPGDLLYVVKLAHEKQQVRRATTEKERVEVLLKQAATRVGELQQLHDEGTEKTRKLTPQERTKHTQTVIASLKEKIETTNTTLEQARQTGEVHAAAVALVVEEETEKISEQISDSFADTQQPGLQDEAQQPQEHTAEVTLAVQAVAALVEETNVKATVVTVESLLDTAAPSVTATGTPAGIGETAAPSLGEAKVKVAKKIEQLEKSVHELQVNAESVITLLQSASTTATASSSASISPVTPAQSAPVSTTPISTTPAPAEIPTVNVTPTHIPVATPTMSAADIQGRVDEVKKEVAQIKELVHQDNLRGAIEKVQLLYILKNDVQKSVDEAKKSISTAPLTIPVDPSISSSLPSTSVSGTPPGTADASVLRAATGTQPINQSNIQSVNVTTGAE